MSQHTQGIDLAYRANSYFWARTHGIQLTSDIKGAERRKIYETALAKGQAARVDPELLQPVLTDAQRQALGRIHPSLMGGEYLPDQKSAEVEIARITIASTTQDVTSVYARLVGKRIHYRVVDEYGGDTLQAPSTRTSVRPLTLGELTDFFLKSWDLIGCLGFNFEDDGYPREQVQAFIVSASSSFYAQFGQLVRARVDEWLDSMPGREEDSDQEDGD
jgi:hypothetical protein